MYQDSCECDEKEKNGMGRVNGYYCGGSSGCMYFDIMIDSVHVKGGVSII